MVEQGSSSPLAAYRENPLLFLLTLSAAVTSIAALLLQLAGIIRMPYTLSFVTAPGMIFLLCAQIWAGRCVEEGRFRKSMGNRRHSQPRAASPARCPMCPTEVV